MLEFTVIVGPKEVEIVADTYSEDHQLTFYKHPAQGGRKTVAIFKNWDGILIKERSQHNVRG